jgi:hypothetical protein
MNDIYCPFPVILPSECCALREEAITTYSKRLGFDTAGPRGARTGGVLKIVHANISSWPNLNLHCHNWIKVTFSILHSCVLHSVCWYYKLIVWWWMKWNLIFYQHVILCQCFEMHKNIVKDFSRMNSLHSQFGA